MKKFFSSILTHMKNIDMFILVLCCISSLYGILLVSSSGDRASVYIQVASLAIGILLFIVFTIIDVDIIAGKHRLLFLVSILFISTLFVWGEAGDSGNRAWLRFGSIGIQPAEVVKIPFIIILAKIMVNNKERRDISSPVSMIQYIFVFASMFVLIILSSDDLGSALVYFFVFAVMLFVGGLNLLWFAGAGAVMAPLLPAIWLYFLNDNQRIRILAPFDKTIDPEGLGIKWQSNLSKLAISSGGFKGQGLYKGSMTQSGTVPFQHTDFVFSVAGEELGFIGCLLIIVLLLAIIVRCLYVGIRSNDTLGLLVCTGIAAMLIFQTFENIGMCLGITPVIGLTLPFFSYGGSSLITNFAAMGIVSGIKMRPKPSGFRR